jgi:hypothetical protein
MGVVEMARDNRLGFLTIAVGAPRYLRQAEILALSLRHNMPGIPLAVVTDKDSAMLREEFGSFADVVIPVDDSLPFSVAQKLMLDRYTPFSETLFIDSDCIATRPFHAELDEIRRFPFSPILESLTPIGGSDEYLEDLGSVLKKIGAEAFPRFNGGVYYFNESGTAAAVFELARTYYADYKTYGIRHFDWAGPADETVIGLALAKLGKLELYDDRGRLMRTPTGLKGSISIEPLGGGCAFECDEGVVRPAICHFAGHYILRPEYRVAEASLRGGIPVVELSSWVTLTAIVQTRLARVARFFGYRIDGIKKRLMWLKQFLVSRNRSGFAGR